MSDGIRNARFLPSFAVCLGCFLLFSANAYSQEDSQSETNSRAILLLKKANAKITGAGTYSCQFQSSVGAAGFITQGHIYQGNSPDGDVEVKTTIDGISANGGKSFVTNRMVVIKNRSGYYTLQNGIAVRMDYMKQMAMDGAKALAANFDFSQTNDSTFTLGNTNFEGTECFVIGEKLSANSRQKIGAPSAKEYIVGATNGWLYQYVSYGDDHRMLALNRYSQLVFDPDLHEDLFTIPPEDKVIAAGSLEDYRLILATGSANVDSHSKSVHSVFAIMMLSVSVISLAATVLFIATRKG